MPFKSESQRRKFQQLVAEGKLTQATYDAWENETPDQRLPEKAPKKPKQKKKSRQVRVIK
jgi:hypothetical protein